MTTDFPAAVPPADLAGIAPSAHTADSDAIDADVTIDDAMDMPDDGSSSAIADAPATGGKGKKKKKKKKAARKKKKKTRGGRRAGSASKKKTKKKKAANGRRKKKKKAGAGRKKAANGRKTRGPSKKTVEKQNFIREMLRVNPQQSINQSIEEVKRKYGTTIQFERAREVHEEFGPIRRGRKGGAAAPVGAGRTGGKGRRAASGKGQYVVTVAAGRGRMDARAFNTPAEVTDYVNRLTQRDGVPLQDINFYQRFEPEISVRF